jgi:hypothetical protein
MGDNRALTIKTFFIRAVPLSFRSGYSRRFCHIEELRERCRTYEFALRKIATEEPNSSAASLAAAALRLFE